MNLFNLIAQPFLLIGYGRREAMLEERLKVLAQDLRHVFILTANFKLCSEHL